MSDRYYEAEHFAAYARIRRDGLTQWSDLHGEQADHEHFPNRDFLARVLPAVREEPVPRILEYGCGTGPAASFLAARGYLVHAVDLVPDAITVARRFAAERGLRIRFDVQDVCRWGPSTDRFDYVIDSYCLQSIVLDEDRRRLFAGVRARLAAGGRYVVSTATVDPDRDYGGDRVDPSSGVVRTPVPGPGCPDAEFLDGSWFIPHRRHLTGGQLRTELEDHGFHVIEQTGRLGGDLVCETRA